eukprot:TRINITY_DN627_c0_g1_i3.p2 TRINITY_DN627_c0_g1~~TRINITY_DN627_c0_g1_i3.p2  ORF type:complete len:107 (+),score=19.54 TRINITY_DN627_c0_g1_i3:110-430(+)
MKGDELEERPSIERSLNTSILERVTFAPMVLQQEFRGPMLLCQGCSILLSYESLVESTTPSFAKLRGLFNYGIGETTDELQIALVCAKCQREVGMKAVISLFWLDG